MTESEKVCQALYEALNTADPVALDKLRGVITEYERKFPRSVKFRPSQLKGMWSAMHAAARSA